MRSRVVVAILAAGVLVLLYGLTRAMRRSNEELARAEWEQPGSGQMLPPDRSAPPTPRREAPPAAAREWAPAPRGVNPTVFVPIAPESLASLDAALKEKAYGEVAGPDFVPRFRTEAVAGEGQPAVTCYAEEALVPRATLYLAVGLRYLLTHARDDRLAVVLHEGGGKAALIREAELDGILATVPEGNPPLEVRRKP